MINDKEIIKLVKEDNNIIYINNYKNAKILIKSRYDHKSKFRNDGHNIQKMHEKNDEMINNIIEKLSNKYFKKQFELYIDFIINNYISTLNYYIYLI